jgi:glucose-6-phosphate 1-epimerase
MSTPSPDSETDPRTEPGRGGLPKLVLRAADGGEAEVYLHGAHLASWRPSGDGDERIYLSARSPFAAGTPIRGGVPVSFPQFATDGPLPHHGFARVMNWRLVDVGIAAGAPVPSARATFRLVDTDATRALWPHPFALELTVTVGGDALALALAVANTGGAPLAFTGALHTYLAVDDVAHATVHGLQGAAYRDKVLRRDGLVEAAADLRIDGEVDRVYFAAPEDLALREPRRATAIRATGFPDTVVWNPGARRAAPMADLEPGGYARMLCVEAAAVRAPIVVAPGACWRGTQTLEAR